MHEVTQVLMPVDQGNAPALLAAWLLQDGVLGGRVIRDGTCLQLFTPVDWLAFWEGQEGVDASLRISRAAWIGGGA